MIKTISTFLLFASSHATTKMNKVICAHWSVILAARILATFESKSQNYLHASQISKMKKMAMVEKQNFVQNRKVNLVVSVRDSRREIYKPPSYNRYIQERDADRLHPRILRKLKGRGHYHPYHRR
jgi:hypothetical protein